MDNALKFRLDLDNADFMASAEAAATTTRSLGSTTKGSMAALKAIQRPLEIIGFTLAPQLTSNLTAVGHTMSAVNTSAKQLQIGLGPLALGLAGLGAVALSATEYMKQRAAEKEAAQNEVDVNATADVKMIPGLGKVIDRLVAGGFMGGQEGNALKFALDTTKGTDTALEVVRMVQNTLKPLVQNESRAFAQGDLNKALSIMGRALLPKAEQDRLKIADEVNKQVTELLPLAKAAGVSPAAIVNLGEQIYNARIAELNAVGTKIKPASALPVTDLERMGFAFRGAGGNADYQRNIDRNTAETSRTLKAILAKLGPGSTTNID
jgi:hypothetical protein